MKGTQVLCALCWLCFACSSSMDNPQKGQTQALGLPRPISS